MGFGDEILALGQAQSVWERTGRRALIVGRDGRPRWSEVWDRHPAVVHPDHAEHGHERVVNGPHARPCIERWETDGGKPRAIYSGWRARDHIASLRMSYGEFSAGADLRARLGPYVVVEPHVKAGASPNKDWGIERYRVVRDLLSGVRFVQVGPENMPDRSWLLRGVDYVVTPTFRDACGVLASAAGYLGPEGGLHHAAAALRRPAVVIFGTFISPMNTGYPFHWNLTGLDAFSVGHAPCGRWAPCDNCARALDSIRPEDVAEAVGEMLQLEPNPPRGEVTHAL